MNKLNTNILVVDDEESVQRNVTLTLSPQKADNKGLDQAADVLFGSASKENEQKSEAAIEFNITTASNGQTALELVEKSLVNDTPYAVIFCDMRMPGWDGLKTIEEIRAKDPRIEVVFLTAFSDHSISDIARSIGVNISYMSKPFSRPDLIQMATRTVVDWNKARELEVFVETMSKMRGHEKDFETILNYIIGELCILLESDSAAIAEQVDGNLIYRAGKGYLANQGAFDKVNAVVAAGPYDGKPLAMDGVHVVPILSFGVALTVATDEQLRPDKQYLIDVFMEHASIALRNCQLQTQLTEQERLAEIGQAIGFVSHDIRGPIGQAEMLIKMVQAGRGPWPPEVMYEKILHALQQAKELADDILQFSKSNITIQPSDTCFSELVARDEDYWNHLALTYDVTFSIKLNNDSRVHVDEARFMRAITNIIKNAIEATSTKDVRQVSVNLESKGSSLVVSVKDSAGGIPSDILPNLFKPFASSGKSHGTGFGLAIADKVVSLHNGSIEVLSTELGTEFLITVPDVVIA